MLLSGLLLSLPAVSASLFAELQSDPAQVDACSFYSETSFRELIGQDGEYFSQSADAAYRRLADGTNPAPDFSGCWWRLGFADDAFIMMQLRLYAVAGNDAKTHIDMQLEAARKMQSPLLPEEIDGLGDAALWSRLAATVRWRHGDAVLLELMISEQVTDANPLLDSGQRKQSSIRAARAIDQAIRHAYPAALTHP